MKQIKLLENSNSREDNQGQSFKQKRLRSESAKALQFASSRQRSHYDRQQFSPESPSTMRLSRTPSKISQTSLSSEDQIKRSQRQINSLIKQLDGRLKQNYHTKQDLLIQTYRQQLIKAHKNLIELKNNTNQQQIKNQMNEKSLQLKKQRLQLIQVNMFYSNKCLEYKKLLEEKINEGAQLQKEIKFLQKQINNTQKSKLSLMSQVYEENSPLKNLLINETPQKTISLQNISIQTEQREILNKNLQIPNKKTSLSTHANTQTMRKLLTNSDPKDQVKIKIKNQIQINSQVKKLFEDKLISNQENSATDRQIISQKKANILTKISNFNAQSSDLKEQNKKQQTLIQDLFARAVNQVLERRVSKKHIPSLKGEQYTDIQKKQIMKTFLSKQQVKQCIYSIIFDKVDDSIIFKKKTHKQKFKIIASEKKEQHV